MTIGAAGAVLIGLLLCPQSALGGGLQQAANAQPPPADQKPPTSSDPQKGENDDLDKIPSPESPSSASDPGKEVGGRIGNQRVYVENAFTGSNQRSTLVVPSPQEASSTWQERIFFDVRREWRVGNRLSLGFSDRVNLRTENDLSFPTQQNVINDWREGFLSWEVVDRTYVDAGRINLKSGAALGFNPTDFFKTRAVVEPLSADPSVLREDRLGTFMLRMQRIWTGGALTVAFAPALSHVSPIYANTALPSFDPSVDRTNAKNRILVKGSVNIATDFSPELLVYREGDRTRFGVNLTRGIGQSIVAYAEWAGGNQAGVIDDAVTYGRQTRVLPIGAPSALPDDSAVTFQQDLSVGGSFSTKPKLTINVEYHLHQAGFARQDWKNWFSAGQATTSTSPTAKELWFIRNYALDRQEPLTRHSLFARADWVDALIRHLELTGFVNMDLYDRSCLTQIAADYFVSSLWTVGVQASANVGGGHSDFGSLPQVGSLLVKVARYF